MIHFDFIVQDADAENIFDCINNEICRNKEKILDCIINNDNKMKKLYENDIKYLNKLKISMLNKKI